MSGFREPGFADRQKAAQEARKNLLNKFKSQPGPDDPSVAAKRAEREALAAKRAEATKTFYAGLTPEQQKTFDAETVHFGGHGGHRGHHGHGGPDGQRGAAPAKG